MNAETQWSLSPLRSVVSFRVHISLMLCAMIGSNLRLTAQSENSAASAFNHSRGTIYSCCNIDWLIEYHHHRRHRHSQSAFSRHALEFLYSLKEPGYFRLMMPCCVAYDHFSRSYCYTVWSAIGIIMSSVRLSVTPPPPVHHHHLLHAV